MGWVGVCWGAWGHRIRLGSSDRHVDSDISKGQRTHYWKLLTYLFRIMRDAPPHPPTSEYYTWRSVAAIKHSEPLDRLSQARRAGKAGRSRRIGPRGDYTSPCHACPCITAPQPGVSRREQRRRRRRQQRAADILRETAAAVALHRGSACQSRLNDDPHLTFDIMFLSHTHARWRTHIQALKQRGCICRETNTLFTDEEMRLRRERL